MSLPLPRTAIIAFALTTLSSSAHAAFEYALNAFSVAGSGFTDFAEDFDDGVIDPPAFANAGTTPTVSGGHALFDSTDPGQLPPGSFPPLMRFEGVGGFGESITDEGAGTLTVTAHFRNDVASIAAAPFGASFGISYASFNATGFAQAIGLIVQKDTDDVVSVFFINDDFSSPLAGITDTAAGSNPIGSPTGDIILRLVLDQMTNEVTPQYSINGGTADTDFIKFVDWVDNAGGAQTLIFDDSFGPVPSSFGIGPVPIPAAVWLFGSALGLLGWRARKAR